MASKRADARRLRVYEQWQGNERFFCWGHCVTGPSWKSGLGSLVLLAAPTAVFLVLVAPYMAARVSPAILVVSCVLPCVCAVMLLLTSCRDPGILPRQEPDEEWLQSRKPRAKDVAVNGQRVTVRYNDTCHFYQPPRAHHCSVNDNCIERFDHHCPWVGTTIGKRNYRTFLLFIYSTSAYIAWTFGVSLGSLFVRHRELVAAAAAAGGGAADGPATNLWLQTLSQSGAAIALMIFTFIFFWFVFGLSGFHTWLVATNQTTYENFRYNHSAVPNPYDQGVLRNCASVWCVPVPPSKVQFRAFVDEVKKVPVEMGYPDWSAAALSPMRSPGPLDGSGGSGGAHGGAHSPALADALDAGLAGGGAAAQRGALGAAVPEAAQGYDSLTEQGRQAPIDRTGGRSDNWAARPGDGPPALGGGGGGADGVLQAPAHQWLPPVAPEHVSVDLPALSNGNSGAAAAAGGGGGGKQALQPQPQQPLVGSELQLTSPRAGAAPGGAGFVAGGGPAAARAAAAGPRSGGGWSGGGELGSSIGGAASTQTEYHDARQSEASSWSREELEEVHSGGGAAAAAAAARGSAH
ncbi:PAT04 [Scenedesmus sp. PABB004]|nr:PAT04 [Scenedesmus sp. PABB004]